jgi:hypothetical protein
MRALLKQTYIYNIWRGGECEWVVSISYVFTSVATRAKLIAGCAQRELLLLASAKEAAPKRRLHGYVALAGAAEREAASGIKNMEGAPRVFYRPNQDWTMPVSDLEQFSSTGAFTFLLSFLQP